jgi:hypothetical protein
MENQLAMVLSNIWAQVGTPIYYLLWMKLIAVIITAVIGLLGLLGRIFL